MEKISSLPGIGKVVEEQLGQVGITTPEELRAVGSREAWLRIQAIDPSACYNRLGALEGAIQGVLRKDLPEAEKESLRAFYRAHKL